jgi:DNA polymerase-3 subunit chi
MTEVYFYHLERRSLEDVLPGLLERSLERQWRAVVQAGSPERAAALDAWLWTYRDDSFLPHGAEDDTAAEQPVFLTTEAENPNNADVLFLVDGAPIVDIEGYRRAVLLFDGNDPSALAEARETWKRVKAAGHDATYWQQGENGRWEKKA